MSEKKMPALPEPDARGQFSGLACIAYTAKTVERIRAEAVEFGRQHERERLEPLRVAVEAHDRMCEKYENGDHEEYTVLVAHLDIARVKAVDAARALLEQTE